MRIITLGTSAGRPTPLRSASAVSIEYEGEAFLFDCGEGTQLQIIQSSLRWGNLKAIFITHLHGDHLNGLPGLVATLSFSEREAPLAVFGPVGIKRYFSVMREIRSMWLKFPVEITEIQQPGILMETPQYQIETEKLDHTIECWGYVFREKERAGRFDPEKANSLGIPNGPLRGKLVRGETVTLPNGNIILPETLVGPPRPGRSVAYCLDTRPCKGSLKLGDQVDVLIHEATFENEMEAEISGWGHSTARQAAQTAIECGAKKLLLTHISPRYGEGRNLLKQAKHLFSETELASDLKEWELLVPE